MQKSKRYEQYMYSYPHKNAYKPIKKEIIQDAIEKIQEKSIALYIHIPFCMTRCGYCNLFAITASEQMVERYIDTVCRQIQQYSELLNGKNTSINNVIFGGGTPLILSIKQFERLIESIKHYFKVDLVNFQFDIETSPNETTMEKLEYLKKQGMRRISIGVQSFYDEELKKVYRNHDRASCHKALGYIKSMDPLCLNIDLIYGIEDQTIESFESSIKEALCYDPDEFFIYPLYIRENTMLFNKSSLDEEFQYSIYQHAVNLLKQKGYRQTSMRRFTKQIELEQKSCGFEQVLSLGCGGRSYIDNVHFCEPYEVNNRLCKEIIIDYIKKKDFLEDIKGYILNKDEQMRRFIIKNLGYYRGVSISEFEDYFREPLWIKYKKIWEELKGAGLININGDFICLTDEGMGYSDQILTLWISDEVKKGMQRSWKE
ncbi:STM4012 family radical SAM protein [Tissierellaceae bacterium HCP3S3_D8]